MAYLGVVRPQLSLAKMWATRITQMAQRIESAQDPHSFYAQDGHRADIYIEDHERSSILFRDLVIDDTKTRQPLLTIPELEIEQGERCLITGGLRSQIEFAARPV